MKAFSPQRFCWIGGFALAALLLSGGCAHQKQPAKALKVPAVTSAVTHYADQSPGRATGKPTTGASAADALSVSIEWMALQQMPGDGVPLAAETRVLFSAGGADPLLVLPNLTRGTRIVRGADIGSLLKRLHSSGNPQVASLGSTSGALPPAVTASFSLSPAVTDRKTGRSIEINVHRPATQPVSEISFVVEAPMSPAPPRRERATLDPIPLADPLKVALIVPFAFESSAAKSVLAVVTIQHGNGEEFQQALARCEKDMSNHNIAATQPTTRQSPPSPALAAGIEWLQGPQDARRAMLFLASQTRAPLAADVALVADDATIAQLRVALLTKLTTGGPIEEGQVGWTLESICFAHLTSLQATEKLPPELASVLTRFAGEAGRHDSSLEELTKNAHSQDELAARMIAENYIYLEDNSPSARVRAFDWLTARGRAPAGYDPLAPLKERRAALDRAATVAAGGRP